MNAEREPARAIHVISSTRVGGAEIMLEKYLSREPLMPGVEIICLTPMGKVGERLQRHGVPVHTLDIRSIGGLLPAIRTYSRMIKLYRPRLVVAWMYHSGILALLHRVLFKGPPVVWTIRTGLSDYENDPWQRKLLVTIGKWLSPHARLIVYNSERSRQQHAELGYAEQNVRVVYNGFDPMHFSGIAEVGVRRKFGIDADAFLVGVVGRNVAVKRMTDAVRLCTLLRKKGYPAQLLCVGRNYDAPAFRKAVAESGMEGHVHCAEEVDDTRPYFAALDLFCLCSASEGFPNVVGEAAFCGVPVVATDVSDLRGILLEDWQVAPVGDVATLAEIAERIADLTEAERAQLIKEQKERFAAKCELSLVRNQLDDAFVDEPCPKHPG